MQHRQLSKQLLEYSKVVRAHRQMNSIVEQFAIN